ncbi:MAG: alpha/beta hydrolase, partial [Proteobacteria bacterium]|nr:alpha/beta hydrolase [Pseudomonadota bacterium]
MSVGLSGCSALDALDAIVPEAGYVAAVDLPYGAGPRQRLDVYRPAAPAARPAPVLVFFYGGNWQTGARRDYRFVGQALAAQGFVTVVPDYRLYPEVRYPGFVEDGAAAVAWTAANIARFGGDPRRIVVAGHSAGAHTALMLALNPGFGVARGTLAGAVGLAGPYDFEPTGTTRDILAVDRGGPSAMPIDYADGTTPPVLLITGDADTTVYPRNSERLAARIRARGGRAELIVYPGVGHIRVVAALAAPLAWLAPVRADVAAFLTSVAERSGGTASAPSSHP